MRNTLVRSQFVKKNNIRNYSYEVPYGSTRADIVVKNNSIITSYEIKAEGDNFSKLERQLTEYAEFSSFVYVIVPKGKYLAVSKFLEKKQLEYVGIILYQDTNEGLFFKTMKKAKRNVSSNINLSKAIHNIPRYFIYETNPTMVGKIQKEIREELANSTLKSIWNKYLTKKINEKKIQ